MLDVQSYLLQYATKIKPLPKHILFYHLGVSNDQMPRWIWNLEAYILSAAFFMETWDKNLDYIPVYTIQMVYEMEIL